jgi:lysyl-tRNA synthetase class 1
MLRTQPRSVINFSPNYETITRLFRDYDTLIDKYQADTVKDAKALEDLVPLIYSQLNTDEQVSGYQAFDFSTLISLLQIPHLDLEAEIAERSDNPLSDRDWEVVCDRIRVGKKWLQDYADEEEKLVLYLDSVPEKASTLTTEQVTYLEALATNLAGDINWEGEELQTLLFSTSKQVEVSQKSAFAAVYYTFLNKERGPKAGSLLSYLDKAFVIQRIQDAIALNLTANKS